MTTVDLITKEIAGMSDEQQRRVLEFARNPSSRPPGVKLEDLRKHIGTLSAADAEEMQKAIEEGCEQIDAKGW